MIAREKWSETKYMGSEINVLNVKEDCQSIQQCLKLTFYNTKNERKSSMRENELCFMIILLYHFLNYLMLIYKESYILHIMLEMLEKGVCLHIYVGSLEHLSSILEQYLILII